MTELRPNLLTSPDLMLAPERLQLRSGCEAGQAMVARAGVITEVGRYDLVAANNPDLVALDLPGHLVMPGFIDAHHHLTQSFGKALAFGEPSAKAPIKRIHPKSRDHRARHSGSSE